MFVEILFEEKHSPREVSHGTHFFKDLIVAEIALVGIYLGQEGVVFSHDMVKAKANNILPTIVPDYASLASTLYVIHVPSSFSGRFFHVYQDGLKQRSVGIIDEKA